MGQQLQGEAQTKTTYTGFKEVAKTAQDAPEASGRSVAASQAGVYGVRGRTPTDGAATPKGSGDDRALRAAGGRLSGPGAGPGTGDPQKGSSRNGRRSGIGGTRGSEAGRGDGHQGKSRSDAARHYARASDAHPYNGATSDHNGTAGLGRAAGAHSANNGNEAGGSTATGNKGVYRPVRGHRVQLEGGVQRWDEPRRRHPSTRGVPPQPVQGAAGGGR
jgi:hypothetical protein